MTSCRFLTRSNLKNEKFLLLSFLIVIAFDRVKVLLFFFLFISSFGDQVNVRENRDRGYIRE